MESDNPRRPPSPSRPDRKQEDDMPAAIPEDLRKHLRRHGQEHALAFADRLDDRGLSALVNQLRALDLEQLTRLYAQRGKTYAVPPADRIGPVPVVPHDSPDAAARRALGEEA